MAKGMILVPRGSLSSEEMELLASKLFKIGYAVRKVTIKEGQNKGSRCIEYWSGEESCMSM